MTMNKKIILLGLSLPVLMLSLLAFKGDDKRFEMAKNLDLFASLYSEVNKYYVDEINPNTVLRTGIDAMLKKLDPYTVYIPEDDIEDFRTNATGEYGGIGIQSNKINGKHLILNLYKDSPAYNVGLKIGDQLTAIDGIPIIELSDDQVGKLMKGQSGSGIFVEVSRQGKLIVFETTREKINIPNISYSSMLNEEVGYLRLSEFRNDAAVDVQEAAESLKKQGATKLIIDLRSNPGGLLFEAVDICNLFIPKGSKVVDTKGKLKVQSNSYVTKKDPFDLSIPLVVLINESSASASEIVSGVIQDYDRGVVIGQKSFGKGLVQVSKKLVYNSQLKVTIAKYYTPSGRCIQALDYSNRKTDGSVGKIADSLKTEFRTTNNRKVFDGGGVDPDLSVPVPGKSSFTKNLEKSMLIYDYANRYYYAHDSIAGPKEFIFSDQDYQSFIAWMSEQQFENKSNVESTLEELKGAAADDKVYHQLVSEIEAITNVVETLKSNGLNTFKDEIVKELENEIILRYYLTPGQVESTLSKDKDIETAIQVLSDQAKYNSILKG